MIPRPVSFAKLNAAGNDFVCIDNTQGALDGLLDSDRCRAFVQAVCRRGLGVGADGLILASHLGAGQGVDVVARFLEPDGSEARLCGNGTACFSYWVVRTQLLAGPCVTILTAAGTAQGKLNIDDPYLVTVCVPDPTDLHTAIELKTGNRNWHLDYVDTGVPHAIAYVNDLESVDVLRWGQAIRRHPHFAPPGVNANFVQVLAPGHIAVRTYEFGVESETLACGTGSAAAAILTTLRQGWNSEYRSGREPVKVDVRGGGQLLVWFVCEDGLSVSGVCLQTRVRPVYEAVMSDEFIDAIMRA